MYLLLTLFFTSLFAIIFMIGKKLILINDDILNFKFPLPLPRGGLGRGELIKNLPSFPSLARRGGINKYKLIANIPYNITGAILKKFLSCDTQPERMVLLVQKEVAKRIVSQDGKESILSISVKAYGTPKYVMKVEKRFFSPEPKVDSAILKITNISRHNFKNKTDENIFFHLIKTGFAHKRKILRKNLENLEYLEVRLPDIDKIFEKLGIDANSRAEDIKIEKWLDLTAHLSTEI